jgi:uncharacterized protein YyaL (SSP411 family)
MIAALGLLLSPPASVLLIGDAATTAKWHAALGESVKRSVRVYDMAGWALPPELRKGSLPDSEAAAWVCRGTTCLPPIATLAGIERELA